MTSDRLQAIKDCIIKGESNQMARLCQEALKQGIPAYEIVMKGMKEGMEVVGKKYEGGEYFLPDLVLAGEIMKEGMSVLEPQLAAEGVKSRGTIIAGSVAGDIHDIGKNIVISMLRGAGFSVIDLGVNVAAETFLERAIELKADIVAASAYLSTTALELRDIVPLIHEDASGRIKVAVGGATVSQEFAREIGADGWAPDALQAVKMMDSIIRSKGGETL
jgi:5-methyltetrahydrofolate--homocysteine methyltransferase